MDNTDNRRSTQNIRTRNPLRLLGNQSGYMMIVFAKYVPFALLIMALVLDFTAYAILIGECTESTKNSMESAVKNYYVDDHNVVYIDEPAAADVFYQYLALNLKLDENMIPQNRALFDGAVEITEISFIGAGGSCVTTGDTFDYPTMHVKLRAPVKLIFFTLFVDPVYINIHHDVSLEDVLPPTAPLP